MKSSYHNNLAKVHIGAKALGWVKPDDTVINSASGEAETYREMLQRIIGNNTTKGASGLALSKVITYFEKLGWQAKRPKKKLTTDNWREPRIKYIKSLWSQLAALSVLDNPSDEGLAHFCNNLMRGNDINFALSYELNNIIEALKQWNKRVT